MGSTLFGICRLRVSVLYFSSLTKHKCSTTVNSLYFWTTVRVVSVYRSIAWMGVEQMHPRKSAEFNFISKFSARERHLGLYFTPNTTRK